jgi:hypothetical protein
MLDETNETTALPGHLNMTRTPRQGLNLTNAAKPTGSSRTTRLEYALKITPSHVLMEAQRNKKSRRSKKRWKHLEMEHA